ncbi:ATP-dependent protease [Herminiimonas sp. KBW02]|uniref:LON peptidase substrate-binding domain-containing protein n=1 Tax=Herminiimonas sp. KBW02 TaxID=2153363 RepID=UPI000F5B139F|nr:LON peptidase substrate-binding domain-containing protein [Herminiimonas sp. KBW02]RQO34835.1 ATP-dependent protease [Herminiimonas sp. KBW02]
MPANEYWLPLFPLNTVLFPGGILPLKVFETRYIDMVRDCMKRELPFGVVLIKSGQEIGVAAEPEDVGCMAHIVDWDAPQLGVLLLRTEGGTRFRILETRVHKDQHLEARVQILGHGGPSNLTKEHEGCANTLGLVIHDINTKGRAEIGAEFESPFTETLHLDDAGWVANRWCEILPIPLKARQKLLEVDDAQTRLTIIQQYLQQHEII